MSKSTVTPYEIGYIVGYNGGEVTPKYSDKPSLTAFYHGVSFGQKARETFESYNEKEVPTSIWTSRQV